MSAIAKKIDEAIKLDLAPYLKSLGYRKKRNSFHLISEGHVCVIEIQSSSHNRGNEGKFTINLGKNFTEIEKVLREKVIENITNAGQCTINRRIGHLMPHPRDTWWKISVNTDIPALSKEVRLVVEEYGIPWLKQISTLQDLKKEVGDWPYLTAASISLVLNQPDDVCRHLNEYIEGSPHSLESVREWVSRNNNLSNRAFKLDWVKLREQDVNCLFRVVHSPLSL